MEWDCFATYVSLKRKNTFLEHMWSRTDLSNESRVIRKLTQQPIGKIKAFTYNLHLAMHRSELWLQWKLFWRVKRREEALQPLFLDGSLIALSNYGIWSRIIQSWVKISIDSRNNYIFIPRKGILPWRLEIISLKFRKAAFLTVSRMKINLSLFFDSDYLLLSLSPS